MSKSSLTPVEAPAGPGSAEWLAFFKALSDASRLRIVALLGVQELTVEQLADRLGLTSSTVSHHLARLAAAGLVSARAESYYSIYRLEGGALVAMARRLLKPHALGAVAAEADVEASDRKALRTVLDDGGRIQAFPTQPKQALAVLRHVSRVFEAGRRYPEKHVHRLLARFSADTARLRRDLVESGFLERGAGSGEYRRADPGARSHAPQTR
jgi:biotin operon repressor